MTSRHSFIKGQLLQTQQHKHVTHAAKACTLMGAMQSHLHNSFTCLQGFGGSSRLSSMTDVGATCSHHAYTSVSTWIATVRPHMIRLHGRHPGCASGRDKAHLVPAVEEYWYRVKRRSRPQTCSSSKAFLITDSPNACRCIGSQIA